MSDSRINVRLAYGNIGSIGGPRTLNLCASPIAHAPAGAERVLIVETFDAGAFDADNVLRVFEIDNKYFYERIPHDQASFVGRGA